LHPGPHRGVGPVHAGLETRTGGGYHWDGLKRGIDPAHPVAILQYTLAGWGMYDDPSTSQRVGPGRLFVAIVPGPHRYYLPPQAPAWTFFYLLIRHDYIVARLAETQRQCGAVVDVPADAPLVGRMVAAWRDAVG